MDSKMNERFWELVEQADEQGGDDPDIRDRVFAELIVRECMMLCGAVSGAAQVARPNDAFGDGAEKCKTLIKEHFGVEE